jgi:toxin ParE1/3/4
MARRYRVIWTPVAQKDLESLLTFVSQDSVSAAVKIFKTVRLKASLLYKYPERGRIPPEISHIPGLSFRELVFSPWRLIYRVKRDRVEILAFFDGRRDLSETLFERLSRIG